MAWLWTTLAMAALGGLVGLFIPIIPWPRMASLVSVVAGAVVTAFVAAHMQSESPAWGWWLLSVLIATGACALVSAVAQSGLTWQSWIVIGCAAALVGGGATVGYQAGHVVAKATITTPHNTDNVSSIDPGDCSQASLSSSRLDKPNRWAALGDSYSAGVGGELNGTASGQDITNAFAWAGSKLLYNPVDKSYFGVSLSACSGAVMREVFHTVTDPTRVLTLQAVRDADLSDSSKYWYQLPDSLQSLKDAAVVTLTIGGNDAGFGNIAKSLGTDGGCLRGKVCSLLADGGLANIEGVGHDPIPIGSKDVEWRTLRERLENAYAVTRTLMRHDGDLYIIKYPLAFAEPHAGCIAGDAIGPKNMGRVNIFAATLDATIEQAAASAAKETGRPITVLAWGGDKTSSSGKFDGPAPFSKHGICGVDPWLNDFGPRVDRRTVDDSFHPSTAGALAAACATAKTIATSSYFATYGGYVFTSKGRCEDER